VQLGRNSDEFKDARKIGDKYAKFRAFAIEGLPQAAEMSCLSAD
jgi:hypothetical protein